MRKRGKSTHLILEKAQLFLSCNNNNRNENKTNCSEISPQHPVSKVYFVFSPLWNGKAIHGGYFFFRFLFCLLLISTHTIQKRIALISTYDSFCHKELQLRLVSIFFWEQYMAKAFWKHKSMEDWILESGTTHLLNHCSILFFRYILELKDMFVTDLPSAM
jgi:hypothetical protein